MSYQVLARKWRPRRFEELVGQEHVVQALVNALRADRVHHAYLFTGTRGVGKTTLARLLAKSLNCERGVGPDPCGECASCLAVDGGRFVDLIEVDGASRTKVEDTRELLDNVQYAPTRGRYKVYLIDEVHMLSGHSFNALLKTLEEPPPHVKFLLATTDPQKLPVTVLSRCQRFALKSLPQPVIAQHLERVLEAEGVSVGPGCCAALAKAAQGSVRDALSLTDQALAYGAGSLSLEPLSLMLGTIDPGRVVDVLDAIADDDGAEALAQVQALDELGADFQVVLDELAIALQRTALLQLVPSAVESEWPELDRLKALAARMSAEAVQVAYDLAVRGRRDLPLAPDPRIGFEMTVLRLLCFRADAVESPASGVQSAGEASPGRSVSPAAAPPRASAVGGGGLDAVRAALGGRSRRETADAVAVPAPSTSAPAPAPAAPAPRPVSMRSPTVSERSEPPVPVEPSRVAAIEVPQSPVSVPEAVSMPTVMNDIDNLVPAPAAERSGSAIADEVAAVVTPGVWQPDQWRDVLEQLPLKGLPRQLAMNAALVDHVPGRLTLALSSQHMGLKRESVEGALQQALEAHLGGPLRLVWTEAAPGAVHTPAEQQAATERARQQAAEASIQSDSGVRGLLERFGAEIRPGSVTPLDS